MCVKAVNTQQLYLNCNIIGKSGQGKHVYINRDKLNLEFSK